MKKLSLSEPVTELRRVPIVESGEPLVDFLALCPLLSMDAARFQYERATLIRESVAHKLCQAARNLPSGYKLLIVEGWRAPHIQRRMYLSTWKRFQEQNPHWSETKLKRVVNRFTAPINLRVPPPHTTGGAVDLALADENGAPVDVRSPYEMFDPLCFAFNAPRLSETARRHREILWNALILTGITNYPSEYWHWSYGDQGWAYRGGHPHALYGAIDPPGWTPDKNEMLDAPLEWAEEFVEKQEY